MTKIASNAALAVVVVFSLVLASAAPAFAQSKELKPILDRLQRLERDIKTLNVQVSQGGTGSVQGATINVEAGSSSSAAARTAVRLTDLEDELRAATGKVEAMTNSIEQIGSRLDKLVADLDYRLGALERGGVGQSPQVTAAPSPPGVVKALPGASQPGLLGTIGENEQVPAGQGEQQNVAAVASGVQTNALPATPQKAPDILPEGTVKERYAFASGLLRQAEYDQAEVALNEFLAAHPDDPLSGNARYWLAESFYVRGQYERAAKTFFAGYQADPSGAKAPDMLLKLGMSMSNLNNKDEACASFGKLLNDFPEGPNRILAKLAFESKKIGCE